MELLKAMVRSRVTVLVSTHDPALLDLAERVFMLCDGQLADEPLAAMAGR